MAGPIRYCDHCKKRVLRDDVEFYDAIANERVTLCPECAKTLSPEERKAALGMGATAPATRERKSPLPTSAGRGQKKGNTTKMVAAVDERGTASRAGSARKTRLVAAASSVAFLLVVTLVIAGASANSSTEDETSTDAGVAPAQIVIHKQQASHEPRGELISATRAVHAAPTAQGLAAIEAMCDGSLDRYRDVVAELKEFGLRCTDADACMRAALLLNRVENDLAAVATTRLKLIREHVAAQLKQGLFDEAVVYVRFHMAAFAGSRWYENTGQREFASLLSEIAAKRRAPLQK